MTDPRFPYTYASDLIRSVPDMGKDGCKLSRSEASRIRQTIAEAIGMDDDLLARKLADYYKDNEETIESAGVQKFMERFS